MDPEPATTADRAVSLPRRSCLAAVAAGVGVGLAGCASESAPPAEDRGEATVTVRLRNRDDEPREYEVVVNQGESLRDSFSGVLPANQAEPVEMVATFRVTDEQHDFAISTPGGQRGRTWDPSECRDFLVEARVEDGEPAFDASCRDA